MASNFKNCLFIVVTFIENQQQTGCNVQERGRAYPSVPGVVQTSGSVHYLSCCRGFLHAARLRIRLLANSNVELKHRNQFPYVLWTQSYKCYILERLPTKHTGTKKVTNFPKLNQSHTFINLSSKFRTTNLTRR